MVETQLQPSLIEFKQHDSIDDLNVTNEDCNLNRSTEKCNCNVVELSEKLVVIGKENETLKQEIGVLKGRLRQGRIC